jgi:RNA polymerase sigma-70 factor (ECF subfamily)
MNPLLVPKEKHMIEEFNIENEIERLMNLYGNDVLRTSYLYLKDKQRAEDAFQEVFLKVYKKYNSFKGKSSEKTWIISIAINVCKDMLRSTWLKRVFLTDNISTEKNSEDTDDEAIRLVENRVLFNEVISLQSAMKDVVILYYYQELDTREISSILSIAEGTVRSRLHRAREILKNKLKGRIDFDEQP